MPLVKPITYKIINGLSGMRAVMTVLLTAALLPAFSQDNSPYSRYGLGDIVPLTNINSRAMGGLAAGYTDRLSINYSNPAAYGSFDYAREATSKKMQYGRAILDVGVNLENRTLREPAQVGKFTSSNFLFSHLAVGVPLRRNVGLVFGLRPITRISYKIISNALLKDPITGLPIDSASTVYEGDGGAFLPSVGIGWRIPIREDTASGKFTSISIGANAGYLFGKKDYSSRRNFINDSLAFTAGNAEIKTSYGNIFASAGIQFQTSLTRDLSLTIGAYGNWKQTLNATQDLFYESYVFDETQGNVRLDSVYQRDNFKGKIIYPSSYTAGFVLESYPDMARKKGGWLIGIDYATSKWTEYKYYGVADPTLQDKWELRLGAQLRPAFNTNNYFSQISYRAGAFYGKDYVNVGGELPVLGFSLGAGVPVRNYNRLSPGQATIINLSIEFIKRGNNDNLLKENLFRLSAGFSLSDFWFVRRKYE